MCLAYLHYGVRVGDIMTFTEGINAFFKWAWDLITDIPVLFAWLFDEYEFVQLGLTIRPIYLIGGGAILIGVIRAIIGSIID